MREPVAFPNGSINSGIISKVIHRMVRGIFLTLLILNLSICMPIATGRAAN